MSRICFAIALLICGLLASTGRAETFKLTNGETVTGELLAASANDQGVQIKIGDGDYQRVPWSNFSQEDLKKFAQIQKMEPYVEPFIEITREDRIKRTEPNIKLPPRLERPPAGSLLGAFFSSGLGLLILLLLYAANIFAGYEVAMCRAHPPLVVGGLSAIPLLGFLAPIVFLCLPNKLRPAEEVFPEAAPAKTAPTATAPGAARRAAAADDVVNPMLADGASHPTGLKLAHADEPQAESARQQPVVYQRGQFTFNRRFFETKFAGFFGVVRRDAERDLVLVITTNHGQYSGQRISRIAANELHLQIQRGPATEEILIPFQEIKEIRVQHKNA